MSADTTGDTTNTVVGGMSGDMVGIPGRRVRLGTPEDVLDRVAAEQHHDRGWFEDEAPQHHRFVPGFLIDRHLVTNLRFAEFVAATGYRTTAEQRGFGLLYGESGWAELPGACWRHPAGVGTSVDDRAAHPVVHVSYIDAAAFANWAGARLPTEQEWEYAATGGTFRWWPWGDHWEPHRAVTAEQHAHATIADPAAWASWWAERLRSEGLMPGTAPVGSTGSAGVSPFGVADMAGNVSEWTSSKYQLYDPSAVYDQLYRFLVGRYRVVRGGSWMNFRYQARCAERMPTDDRGYSTAAIGFRCARTDDGTPS